MSFVGDFCDDVARAVGFLSRIPMPGRHFVGYDGRLSRAVRAFPLAGLLIALPSAAIAAALMACQVSSLFAAFVVITIQVLVTGALHEDGLGDTADGFGGGRDREAALDIMKDSRVGTYGAVALALSIGLRVSALASILPLFTPMGASMAILGAAALSRAAMVWHWARLPPARSGGVAAAAGEPEQGATRFALAFGLLAAMLLFYYAKVPALGLIVTLVAYITTVKGFDLLATRKIGGHTGDTIGATQQLTEIVVLGALALTV
ncbi:MULTISPECIES: adenosylcobinamide-GDP ribazoletransferase [unclassified Ensifer]|uniref:adenosylcobinamide-GDP ribazoletransferase n=1 Tax=unclassified Ensifer TaxID=2633371 RepID=UPI0008134C41|nr:MULTISPECIES: adenosylcobinamide-GDP ribazoletransferase [unclassified Ensifer]OCP10226.1 adenosylcobinamide-GDP ribazoletransferase [Ensifer sp. LC13]OCP11224.1 adenosylcobinamide-GDP ribazoletransferase [Ensifer sp. LC11]OCP14703.1 adenosylcobinamide-GDP ribazoletransferase [Ensifer sp. LC14]OCP33184.1 adenosylcobinamide-GDP ribazoletransferase [Ensifer sp. LC499]